MPRSVADPLLRSGLLSEVRLPQPAVMPSIGLVVKAQAPDSDSAAAALADLLRKRFASGRRSGRA